MLKYIKFCTQLTFDLVLGLWSIFRLGIHLSVYCYTSRNTFSMFAKIYSKMPTEKNISGPWEVNYQGEVGELSSQIQIPNTVLHLIQAFKVRKASSARGCEEICQVCFLFVCFIICSFCKLKQLSSINSCVQK